MSKIRIILNIAVILMVLFGGSLVEAQSKIGVFDGEQFFLFLQNQFNNAPPVLIWEGFIIGMSEKQMFCILPLQLEQRVNDNQEAENHDKRYS